MGQGQQSYGMPQTGAPPYGGMVQPGMPSGGYGQPQMGYGAPQQPMYGGGAMPGFGGSFSGPMPFMPQSYPGMPVVGQYKPVTGGGIPFMGKTESKEAGNEPESTSKDLANPSEPAAPAIVSSGAPAEQPAPSTQ